jgi:transcription initiation factor IIE alpha subunit
MDRDKFKQQMKAEMEQVVEKLASDAPDALEDMAAMERRIYAACDAIKAKYLQAWINNANEKGARPVCPHCGGPLRQKEKVKKTSATVGGQVDVARTRWWCNACKASFFPSGPDDQRGGLSDHS